MNDIRRVILWVVFTLSSVLLWDQWQLHNGHQPTFLSAAPAPAAAIAQSNTTPANAAARTQPGLDVSIPSALPQPVSEQMAGQQLALPSEVKRLERFEVTTDVLRLTFDTLGGSLVRAEFLKYADNVDKTKNFVLLDDSAHRVYQAQTGIIGAAGTAFPNHKTPMVVAGPRVFEKGKKELTLRFESEVVGGLKLVKTYTLRRDAYDIAVTHELINASAQPIAAQLYLQLVRDGNKPVGESAFYSTFTGPAVYTEAQKYQKVDFSAIKKKTASFEKEANNGYLAMVQHYFVGAWLLPQGVLRHISLDAVDIGANVPDCCYRATMITPIAALNPGASKTVDAKLFLGPQEEKLLESLAPGFELVKDYGWFTPLSKPLYWLLDWLHQILKNWGWSIVALVVLLKIAFYWLNAKAYASMAKMKVVAPKITEMRERLKNNPQQMQQEMLRLYREEKVNPLGGCFPILIQIPVFIALYWVLLSSVEMRNAPWVLWIHDLSAPDPYYILPLTMTLTTMLQTALNPAPPDPLQAKMMWLMPLIFSVMFFFFPAGLVLYWVTNNILSIAQQWMINARMGSPLQLNLPKFF